MCMQDHQLRFLSVFQEFKAKVAEGYCGRLLTMEAKVSMGSLIRGEVGGWVGSRTLLAECNTGNVFFFLFFLIKRFFN